MIVAPSFPLKFKTQTDARGSLTVIDGWQDIPFAVKRVFWIHGIPEGAQRGGHAHKLCQQVLIAVAGSMRVTANGREFTVDDPTRGLYIPPETSITLDRFSPGAVLLVLCSHVFAEEDYIHEVQRPIPPRPAPIIS